MLDLSPDSFCALARSSPWRWTSVHFRHRSGHVVSTTRVTAVEAWLTRPDGVRIVDADGFPVMLNLPGQLNDGTATRPWAPDVPTYRPDGLVEQRPLRFGWLPDDTLTDDLFWTNYSWVAMLDPLELSDHVDVADLREEHVAGRRAWRATLVAEPGYLPRCGGNCCELLYSEAGLWADFSEDNPPPDDWLGRDYPDAYDVALDLATGIVVRCLPIGGNDAPWLENDILSSH